MRAGVRILTALYLAAALACARGPATGPIAVSAASLGSPSSNVLRVTGLSGTELRALDKASFSESAWQALLQVSVSGNDTTPIVGQYVVTDNALEFQPRYPFDL